VILDISRPEVARNRHQLERPFLPALSVARGRVADLPPLSLFVVQPLVLATVPEVDVDMPNQFD